MSLASSGYSLYDLFHAFSFFPLLTFLLFIHFHLPPPNILLQSPFQILLCFFSGLFIFNQTLPLSPLSFHVIHAPPAQPTIALPPFSLFQITEDFFSPSERFKQSARLPCRPRPKSHWYHFLYQLVLLGCSTPTLTVGTWQTHPVVLWKGPSEPEDASDWKRKKQTNLPHYRWGSSENVSYSLLHPCLTLPIVHWWWDRWGYRLSRLYLPIPSHSSLTPSMSPRSTAPTFSYSFFFEIFYV